MSQNTVRFPRQNGDGDWQIYLRQNKEMRWIFSAESNFFPKGEIKRLISDATTEEVTNIPINWKKNLPFMIFIFTKPQKNTKNHRIKMIATPRSDGPLREFERRSQMPFNGLPSGNWRIQRFPSNRDVFVNLDTIQDSFQLAVSKSVRIFPEGIDRYQIFTPFHFDDGDHFVIILKKNAQGNWIITDEGHTYMHMSYDIDLSSLNSGNRNQIIESALQKHNIQEREGRIFANVKRLAHAGNVLYSFVQCLINITDVSYLSQKRVLSTFMEDFKAFISKTIDDPARFEFKYIDQTRDPDGKYPVDCRVNGIPRPLFLYAINNNNKCRDTTISILQFQSWEQPFLSCGIFEDQVQINRKVLARFTDVCDRQFSSLATNKERIRDFLAEQMQ